MADPVTWIYIAGTLVAAGGAVYQAQGQKNEARYNRQIAERNATIATQQAAVSEAAARRDGRRALGRIEAGYGAAGVVGSEGSPLEVLQDSATEAELDALTIRYNGELAAMGYQDDAAMARMRGSNAGPEGYFRAGSALLQGGANYYANRPPTAPKRT